ncbi:succinyl-diaminopimelate desuccinylase [Parafrankia irregularis]|uniref:Succinyl-diaminopimelate desuccinylase n=1 Tax=Parafrankia irregularis TaxID=795642 RepID=A0A0S4QTK0_9ACTN|nr:MULTISPECIES: succinyl-diaminopimelate desuccinylase [Parafrankia]MBE3205128.1 succinyl-diaminopimelate desuccinylase [Parafrankia sp. CH37]CUU58644.1 succinyl-diaminopimelate desuccinylase [Parafrankia irregularis]
MELDLALSAGDLTRALVDVPSVSGDEATLATAVEKALRAAGGDDGSGAGGAGAAGGLEVLRDGDAVLARTNRGLPSRVLLAGHLDTVPVAANLPSRLDGTRLYGCGTSDMKAGVAVMLRLAAAAGEGAATRHDVTWVFYDNEEVAADRNGLRRITSGHRDWLQADLAILMEPTGGEIEAGCQGTVRVVATTRGRRAHSARSWLGDNAIHRAGELLTRLAAYQPRSVTLDGCTYREGLSAVRIDGGVAGNVIPDECRVTVNFRFAPDRDVPAALDHVAQVLDGFELSVEDSARGALPGLSAPAAAAFVAATARTPAAKFGWTDVARFAELGIPALNYGPGDPNLAHTRDEYVELALIDEAERVLRSYLLS